MLRRILTILGYLLTAALVAGATVLLVAVGQGYSYDFKTGRLIRTGLVIIQTSPSGLAMSLDGKPIKKKTPYRSSFEAGQYTFELSKNGFYPWRKTLEVVASEVTLVQYALMVPKHPAVSMLDSKPQIATQAISKDHRHLVYVTSGANAAVYTMDIGGGLGSNPNPVKIYAPKAPATPDDPVETVTDVTWSDDASHLMVVSQVNGAAVYRVMAANGTDVVNLTDQYRFNFTGIRFSSSNGRQLYWISTDGLRRVDLDAQAVSAVLADKVRQFQIAGDRVLYVQSTDLGPSLWSLDSRGHKQELVQALPESESYSIAYINYRGQDELAVVPSRTHVGTLYSDIFSTTPVAKTVARDVNEAIFSPDGHLLTFSAPGNIVTYDLEQSNLRNKIITYQFAGVHNLSALTWFDNFHLLLNEDGHLVWSEFDGANQVGLGALSGVFPAYSSPDLRSIVAIQADGTTAERINSILIKP